MPTSNQVAGKVMNNMKKILILCLAAVVMTGCKTGKGVLSTYKKENVVTEQDLNTDSVFGDDLTAVALGGDAEGLGGLKWRELFTDPVLQALIERVLAQNTDIVNADFQLQEVEHALKAAKLAFAPSISLNLNGASTRPWDPYNRNTYNNTLTYGIAMTLGWQNVNFLALRNAKKGAEISRQQMQPLKVSSAPIGTQRGTGLAPSTSFICCTTSKKLAPERSILFT